LFIKLKNQFTYDKIISEVDMIINVKQTDSIWKAIAKDGIVVGGV
jgi:hypothetical protein